MAAQISFNPNLTTSPANPFQTETTGYVQGAFLYDPSTRMYLLTGMIAASVSGPVFGGMALTENVNAPNSNAGGNTLVPATGYSGTGEVTAFAVFNQASNMLIVPGNSAQMAVAGMSMSYFRLGSGARIPVQCNATLANALDAGNVLQQVSWDFTNQILIPFSVTALPVKVLSTNTNSKIVVNTAGVLSYSTGTCAIIQI